MTPASPNDTPGADPSRAAAGGPLWSDRGQSWLDERLGIGALYRKYGRKAFPVHSSFFLGEMALFAFVILVLTGIYLGFIYVPSNAEITVDGETLPEAYASVRLIESIPVANLFRNTHHWAAHLMVAAVLLHLLRVFFTGTYRKPREINWVVGVVLLGLTLVAGFVGYALPYDSYAVTATGIGFSIARSIPWAGPVASELFFGGAFPTLGSLARLYTIHIFIVPTLLAVTIGAHLLIIVKQKHTQPGYARPLAEPGKVLGVPLWPYQALLAGELLLLMFGALFLLSAVVPPHPLTAFGPPGPATPEVKPDWYLMWIYGFLKIVPPWASFSLFGATIGPNFLGGMLFPAALFGVLTLTPWIDRTNRRVTHRFEYLEPVRQSPVRLASGVATLVFIGTLFIAAYYDTLGLTLAQIWAIVVGVPILVGLVTWITAARAVPAERFDPRESPVPVAPEPVPVTRQIVPTPVPAAPVAEPAIAPLPVVPTAPDAGDRQAAVPTFPTLAARGDRARDSLVAALHEFGELAPLVRQLDDDEDLLEVLAYVDSLRLSLAESNQVLQGVVRGTIADEPVPVPDDLRGQDQE
ncbi:MAG TPA: cytochrome bc complex cytochrome b subunit [Thermomicrobiales bacterium]|nr:cytochrome bc complex cytochrome b subunit [Thermomicrobiales bacterium]